MTWLTWKQFRAQALLGAIVLLLLAAYLIYTGFQARSDYNSAVAYCATHPNCTAVNDFAHTYNARLTAVSVLLIVAPGVVGVFWGAPLLARELETGTYRLAWNQSITRRRWLAVKLLVTGLASVLGVALFSLLLTWCASPFDAIEANRWDSMEFDARNIVPLGYAAFAFALGVAAGAVLRRTVPAMALTVLVFAVVQGVFPSMVRPNLVAPITQTIQVDAQTLTGGVGIIGNTMTVGVSVPGAWIRSQTPALNASGQPVDGSLPQYVKCGDIAHNHPAFVACYASLDLHVVATYQPADRYWIFQWLETAIFAALSAALVVVCFRRIRPRHT